MYDEPRDGTGGATRAELGRVVLGEGLARGAPSERLGGAERLAPTAAGHEHLEVGERLTPPAIAPLPRLLLAEEELELLHVARLRQRARFALHVPGPRVGARRAVLVSDALQVFRRAEDVLPHRPGQRPVAGERDDQGGALLRRCVAHRVTLRSDLDGLGVVDESLPRVGLSVAPEHHHARRLVRKVGLGKEDGRPHELPSELRAPRRRRTTALAEPAFEHVEEGSARGPR